MHDRRGGDPNGHASGTSTDFGQCQLLGSRSTMSVFWSKADIR
jgi:hypothetical protein